MKRHHSIHHFLKHFEKVLSTKQITAFFKSHFFGIVYFMIAISSFMLGAIDETLHSYGIRVSQIASFILPVSIALLAFIVSIFLIPIKISSKLVGKHKSTNRKYKVLSHKALSFVLSILLLVILYLWVHFQNVALSNILLYIFSVMLLTAFLPQSGISIYKEKPKHQNVLHLCIMTISCCTVLILYYQVFFGTMNNNGLTKLLYVVVSAITFAICTLLMMPFKPIENKMASLSQLLFDVVIIAVSFLLLGKICLLSYVIYQ